MPDEQKACCSDDAVTCILSMKKSPSLSITIDIYYGKTKETKQANRLDRLEKGNPR